MARCEQEGVAYLFKLRLTKRVRRTIEKMVAGTGWVDAGKGWEGQETKLRLQGWSCSRRVILLRRLLPDTHDKLLTIPNEDDQADLFLLIPKLVLRSGNLQLWSPHLIWRFSRWLSYTEIAAIVKILLTN